MRGMCDSALLSSRWSQAPLGFKERSQIETPRSEGVMQTFKHRTEKLLVLLALSGVGHIRPLLRNHGQRGWQRNHGAEGMADILFLQVSNSLILWVDLALSI